MITFRKQGKPNKLYIFVDECGFINGLHIDFNFIQKTFYDKDFDKIYDINGDGKILNLETKGSIYELLPDEVLWIPFNSLEYQIKKYVSEEITKNVTKL